MRAQVLRVTAGWDQGPLCRTRVNAAEGPMHPVSGPGHGRAPARWLQDAACRGMDVVVIFPTEHSRGGWRQLAGGAGGGGVRAVSGREAVMCGRDSRRHIAGPVRVSPAAPGYAN